MGDNVSNATSMPPPPIDNIEQQNGEIEQFGGNTADNDAEQRRETPPPAVSVSRPSRSHVTQSRGPNLAEILLEKLDAMAERIQRLEQGHRNNAPSTVLPNIPHTGPSTGLPQPMLHAPMASLANGIIGASL